MAETIFLKTGQFSSSSFNTSKSELKRAVDALNSLDYHGALWNATYTCNGVSQRIFTATMIEEATALVIQVEKLRGKLEAYSKLLQSGPEALQDVDASFKGTYNSDWQNFWYDVYDRSVDAWNVTVGFFNSLFHSGGNKTGGMTPLNLDGDEILNSGQYDWIIEQFDWSNTDLEKSEIDAAVITAVAAAKAYGMSETGVQEYLSGQLQSLYLDRRIVIPPFPQESIHDYSAGVAKGTIRYVNQAPSVVLKCDKDTNTGLTEGWRDKDLRQSSGSYLSGQCNWACESMAFSYLGIDIPPSSMHDTQTLKSFELALGAEDGKSAAFNAVDGKADVTLHSNGWGTSFKREYLNTLVENFEHDGGRGMQSPVMLHYSDGTNMHWILLTGKNADGTYRAIGPWSDPGGLNERTGFDITISDNGMISGTGFSHCGNYCRVDCIGQYTRTN